MKRIIPYVLVMVVLLVGCGIDDDSFEHYMRLDGIEKLVIYNLDTPKTITDKNDIDHFVSILKKYDIKKYERKERTMYDGPSVFLYYDDGASDDFIVTDFIGTKYGSFMCDSIKQLVEEIEKVYHDS